MARPIKPTPTLHGQAAIDFITAMENRTPASLQEREQVRRDAEFIKSHFVGVF